MVMHSPIIFLLISRCCSGDTSLFNKLFITPKPTLWLSEELSLLLFFSYSSKLKVTSFLVIDSFMRDLVGTPAAAAFFYFSKVYRGLPIEKGDWVVLDILFIN